MFIMTFMTYLNKLANLSKTGYPNVHDILFIIPIPTITSVVIGGLDYTLIRDYTYYIYFIFIFLIYFN